MNRETLIILRIRGSGPINGVKSFSIRAFLPEEVFSWSFQLMKHRLKYPIDTQCVHWDGIQN